jgi:hypothetical protein
MPTRRLVIDGRTWQVYPSGYITQYDADEFGLLFVHGVADEREVMVLLKTRSAQLEALEGACGTLHPYKVPELLALDVAAGNSKYVEWLSTETALSLS